MLSEELKIWSVQKNWPSFLRSGSSRSSGSPRSHRRFHLSLVCWSRSSTMAALPIRCCWIDSWYGRHTWSLDRWPGNCRTAVHWLMRRKPNWPSTRRSPVADTWPAAGYLRCSRRFAGPVCCSPNCCNWWLAVGCCNCWPAAGCCSSTEASATDTGRSRPAGCWLRMPGILRLIRRHCNRHRTNCLPSSRFHLRRTTDCEQEKEIKTQIGFK